jgi:hypothetical protein
MSHNLNRRSSDLIDVALGQHLTSDLVCRALASNQALILGSVAVSKVREDSYILGMFLEPHFFMASPWARVCVEVVKFEDGTIADLIWTYHYHDDVQKPAILHTRSLEVLKNQLRPLGEDVTRFALDTVRAFEGVIKDHYI